MTFCDRLAWNTREQITRAHPCFTQKGKSIRRRLRWVAPSNHRNLKAFGVGESGKRFAAADTTVSAYFGPAPVALLDAL